MKVGGFEMALTETGSLKIKEAEGGGFETSRNLKQGRRGKKRREKKEKKEARNS